jgi:integrase
MARSPRVPAYRLHKPSGQAVVTVRTAQGERRDIYLGVYNSPESRTEYARLIAVAAVDGPTAAVQKPDPTVDQVMLAFMRWALTYYRTPDGRETSEVKSLRLSLAPVQELFGTAPAREFGPRALAAVRQRMIDTDLCRNLINKRVDRVKRVFKWAAAEELVPVTVYQALRTLAGLRAGRTEARESKAVVPVDPAHVAATLPHLGRHPRAMVELQRVTGMRPGEVCRLTFAEVDRSDELWMYRPREHKTRGASCFGKVARCCC